MTDRQSLDIALSQLGTNAAQRDAVFAKGHCVVLAGPGSGKTKTLTTAMVRCLVEDVVQPRGIACITYNNECATELEQRLRRLNVDPLSDNLFVGTVHSFALTQVLMPYARCVMPSLPSPLRVATENDRQSAIKDAYHVAIGGNEVPKKAWVFAEQKRLKELDRSLPSWRSTDPQLADFVVAFESNLRLHGMIDFDDMPLLALQMIREHEWIRRSLHAKYPVIFVDEYQDLGHALHEIVLSLAMEAGVRIFAVGDPDQSIYAFAGANPLLIRELITTTGAKAVPLEFNYRCGQAIVDASQAALGEARSYRAVAGIEEGLVRFHPFAGTLHEQADHILSTVLRDILADGIPLDEIAVLYRDSTLGDFVAASATEHNIPTVRADTKALVKRSCKLSRFIEACARWVTGGWRVADPAFRQLVQEAVSLVEGTGASDVEKQRIEGELIGFLKRFRANTGNLNEWLVSFSAEVLMHWRARSRTITENWDAVDTMIRKTDPNAPDTADMPLTHFGGNARGAGRLNLSTMHSSKGREFDAVIMFAMNDDVFPHSYFDKTDLQRREARRLFYVGVTRARKKLHIAFTRRQHSPWVLEVKNRASRKQE